MSVQNEITRLNAAKEAISQAIAEKGVTVPNGAKLDELGALIAAIEAGGGGGGGKFATGVYTPAEDVSISGGTRTNIDFGIGFVPQFFVLFIQGTSATNLPLASSGYIITCSGWICYHDTPSNGLRVDEWSTVQGTKATYTGGKAGLSYKKNITLTENSIPVYSNTAAVLSSAQTYNWYAFSEE